MDYPFVSIIIPVRNVEKIIGQCLKSLNKLNYPKDKYEIIISDSESDDATPSIVQKYGAIFISTPKRSVCAGRNEGFKIAQGEIIAFSDADCLMDKNWIKNSLKYFKNPTIAGVGGPNITPSDEAAFAKAVGFVFNQAIFSAGSIHGRILKQPREVKSLPGCNMIYLRTVLDKVMPMDETLLGGEDYAMNQKIRRLGYRLVYTPDTIVWHYHRATPRKFFKQMYRYGISRILIGRKDLKMINLIHITAGLGLPILIGLFLFLFFINPLWLIYFILFIALFLTTYFFLAWLKLKSLKAAVFVPYAIIILFLSWSMGFLRQLFYPIKEGE
jgi:cellulose synthase/poly-beta-1,6-N-acetylglucosamine synthase-like glycosyltransferase